MFEFNIFLLLHVHLYHISFHLTIFKHQMLTSKIKLLELNLTIITICVNLNLEEKTTKMMTKKKLPWLSKPRMWNQSMKLTFKYSKDKIKVEKMKD